MPTIFCKIMGFIQICCKVLFKKYIYTYEFLVCYRKKQTTSQ